MTTDTYARAALHSTVHYAMKRASEIVEHGVYFGANLRRGWPEGYRSKEWEHVYDSVSYLFNGIRRKRGPHTFTMADGRKGSRTQRLVLRFLRLRGVQIPESAAGIARLLGA